MYAVVMSAVYRHDIIGVFDDFDLAVANAKEACSNERDAHHNFEILVFDLNKRVLDGEYVGEITKQKRESPEFIVNEMLAKYSKNMNV